MHPKITQRNVRGICVKVFTGILLLLMISGTSYSQVLFNEGFNTVVPLPAGWAANNNSNPVGATDWFQGNTAVFPSNSGAPTAYIGANYNNVDLAGTISNWLFTPNVTLKNDDIFTFYTRVPTGGATFPDRLQLRLSTNGASTNVGATETSVGDFTTLLLDINPTYGAAYPEVWTQFTVTIAGLAGPTSGRLAFRYFVEDAGLFGANSNFIGIDDVVYTTFAGPCSGTPVPGATASTVTSTCPNIPFTLTLPDNPSVSGLSYVWQKSADGVTNWQPIAGATQSSLTTSQLVATFYRAVVTCNAGGASGNSTPVQVTMNAPFSCYCPAGAVDQIFEKISNVAFNTIDNPSTDIGGYENFTNISTTVVQQSTLPITVTIDGGFNSDQVIVWIDFNHNGDFTDPGEKVFTSATGAGPLTGNITIPATSLLGATRMRVRMHDSGFGGNTTPCGNSAYGQVEDYTVNIVPCVQGVINTNPANTSIGCSGNATFNVAATGSVLVYQWEQRISATAPWTNVANGGVFSGANTATLTITGAPVSMSGYQYRVIVSGPCTAIITSAAAILTVTPLVATYSPANAALCAGGSVALSITNTAPPVTQQFCSGPISVAIPDGTFPGPYPASTSVIPVAIPTGAIVTKVSVTLNITHNYVGDIVAVLKAPNGQILNLDALLTQTNNGEVDFANTVISPSGTTALSDGVGPFTGTFKADLSGPTFDIFGFTLPGGPIGYTPTTTNWTDLYSTGAGNWTLALYDVGAPDEGLLTSWCLDISYGAPSTGVWGPTANLGTIFTDPALTTPYNGTDPVSTVYVNPATATTYTLVVTNAVCVSGITTIPVAVNTTIANVVTAATVSGCIDGNTTFSVTADGTGIAYQWQESTDGGTTWNNLTDNGFYSGSTTANLTLTGLDGTEDGNKYRVILSNACNSITSTVASFSVFAVPTVTIAAAVTQLYPGITTTLTSTVTPTGAVYQWYRNGVAIPGATSATYTATVDGLGDYTLVAGDVNGCSSTSNTVTISAAPNNILFIYPSPNTGQFQVRYQSLPGNVLPRTLTIYDSKGARVYYKTYDITAPYAAMDVDMTLHATGIYRVELGDRNGNRIKTGSVLIIKQ